MKRLTIILLALAGIFGTSRAQDIFDAGENNRPYFGIRASFDVAIPLDLKSDNFSVDLYKNGPGFSAGAIYNIPVWKNLYFEPGLKIFYNAVGMDVEGMDVDGIPVEANFSVRRFGFRVPLMFGYRFDFQPCSVYVYTGPEIEAGVIGRVHSTLKSGYSKVTESENAFVEEGWNRIDLQWTFGVGVSVDNYYLGLSGNLGMLNMSRIGNGTTMHQNLFQLSLGYNF